MKLVTAILRPERVPGTKAALLRLGVGGLTVARASGHGGERGLVQHVRAATVILEFQEKAVLQVAVRDEQVEPVLAAILEAARTGRVGDGKIFVQPLDRVVRIRTGEVDGEALSVEREEAVP